jgi:creatinine amidohydrolase
LRPDLKSTWIDWWHASPQVAAAVSVDGEDIHANRVETSIVLHLWPDIVDQDAMLTADDADRTTDLTFRYTAEVLSGNGVTGRPSEASASLGETLFTAIVDVVIAKVLAGRDEEPPLQTPNRPNQPTHWI